MPVPGIEGPGRYYCTVYEKRIEMAPWCHTAIEAREAGHLAHDCPYTADMPGYEGRRWAPTELREKQQQLIRKKLVSEELQKFADPEAALGFVEWRWRALDLLGTKRPLCVLSKRHTVLIV